MPQRKEKNKILQKKNKTKQENLLKFSSMKELSYIILVIPFLQNKSFYIALTCIAHITQDND